MIQTLLKNESTRFKLIRMVLPFSVGDNSKPRGVTEGEHSWESLCILVVAGGGCGGA
jgi:hypothetical protein